MSNRFKPKFNIRKGDQVVVIAGDDKDLKKPRPVLEVILPQPLPNRGLDQRPRLHRSGTPENGEASQNTSGATGKRRRHPTGN